MNYSLFFFKGKLEMAPTIVPIYQFVYNAELKCIVGVGYYNKSRIMSFFLVDELIPVEALNSESVEVSDAIKRWNKNNPKNKMRTVKRFDKESIDMHCCFDIVSDNKM